MSNAGRERHNLANFAEEAAKSCERLIGEAVLDVKHLGGAGRRTARISLKDRTVIVTQRKHANRAKLEAETLQALTAHGGAVPQVISFDDRWLIQEDLGQRRLSQALAEAHEADGEALLAKGLTGLVACQSAGKTSKLDQRVITIGDRTEWLVTLATMPERIGERVRMPPPALNVDRLVEKLRPQRPAFIKWDARPANAILRTNSSIAWFDWEHCGRRNPLDDVVWLLCDEYTPHWPAAEEKLINNFLPLFLNGASRDEAYNYFMTFGVLHSCMRLSLILTEKANEPWWDAQECLDQDNVGVTCEMSLRLCERAARWTTQSSLTSNLVDWFGCVKQQLKMD